jgi:hypothetical protein
LEPESCLVLEVRTLKGMVGLWMMVGLMVGLKVGLMAGPIVGLMVRPTVELKAEMPKAEVKVGMKAWAENSVTPENLALTGSVKLARSSRSIVALVHLQ